MTPPRRVVDPELLFGVSLVAGLVLSWPALRSALRGDLDITLAGARLLLSVAFAWACAFAITKLFTNLSAAAERRERAAEHAATMRRRADEIRALGGPGGQLNAVDGDQPTRTASLPAP